MKELMNQSSPLPSISFQSSRKQSYGVNSDYTELARRQHINKMIQARPKHIKKCKWIEMVASRFMLSPSTVRREMEKALVEDKRPKKQKALTSWTLEAIEYMQAYYLKAIKEVGECSKKNAYRATIRECERQGWKFGGQTSAYDLMKKIDPMLIEYAKGGDRALDNYFYIARDLTTLEPMQVVVGDQHIFDWWVQDKETSNVFKPECYLWLDMRTRCIYGIAFAKQGKGYDSDTVRSSLRMGLNRFGKFQKTYNDNGRPELSKRITTIINDVAAYGMEIKDYADLYKTADGHYVVEDKDGTVIGTVDSKDKWLEKNYRIYANVKNAKTKPIERFFSTFEQLLLDLNLPGRIKPLSASAPVEEENQKRLELQKKNGLLLSPEEFILQVFKALEIYENRKHSAFKHSPRQELLSLYHKGWTPTFINPKEVDFMFFNRRKRKIRNGRVLVDGVLLEGEPLKVIAGRHDESIGITQFEGKSVEVRWNPDDPREAFLIAPDNSIRPLREVVKIDSTDREQVSSAMAWKKKQKKAIREKYKAFTSIIDGPIVQSSTARLIEQAEAKRKELPTGLTQEQLEAEAKAVEIQQQSYIGKRIAFKSTHKTPLDRYKWCIDQMIDGCQLSMPDSQFVQTYQTHMSDDQLSYWENYKLLGVK